MPASRPDVIGKYRVERFIESGGMGDVYLARDPVLDRLIAIKLLREGFDSQEMRGRFEREARAAGRLSHPNIVTIYEFGECEGRPFIAMEFVRGEALSKLIRRREPIPLVRKLEMMEGLCSGLAHAHKTGLVHRDVKPANLMVDADGGPLKILDFGIVRMAGSGLTSHGVLVGTVNYMSPEQISGLGTIDHRSDVFAVGAVLHELFTYERAFPGEMTDVLYKIVHTQPASAASLVPSLDPGIVRAIDTCLDKSPERRYQDLGVLRRDLARIRQRLELDEPEAYGHSVATVRGSGVTPYPATPPPTPKPPTTPPQTSPSERARREAVAAEEARRQREAEEARLAREREQAERARAAQEEAERARAELARLEEARLEQARLEQARLEEARREQARLEHARKEQARLEQARRDEAERARVAREQAAQAKAEEARRACEQAERERADAERRAREDAERRAREAIAGQLATAADALSREDFATATRLVEAVLGEQPGHPGARHLEREIVRGVELRGRATRIVEQAHARFERAPAEALELLERFTPVHGLVDAALADLRGRHAARERERLRQERQERRQARVAAVTRQASALIRSRAVQAGAVAVVVAIVAGIWVVSRPAPAPETTRSAAAVQPTPATETPAAAPRDRVGSPRPGETVDAPASPDDGIDRRAPVVEPTPRPRDRVTPEVPSPAPGTAGASPARGSVEPTPVDTPAPVVPPPVEPRPSPGEAAGDRAAAPSNAGGVPEPAAEPAPERRASGRDAAPAAPDPVQIARREIEQWMADYQAAFRDLDERRVKAMNPKADLRSRMLKTASVQFQGAQIDVAPDGRSAKLRATVRYEYSWQRAGGAPVAGGDIVWPLSKVGDVWVANR